MRRQRRSDGPMSDTGTVPAPEGPLPPSDGDQQGQEGQQSELWADPEAAKHAIEKLRRENARYRTERKELEPLARRARDLEEQGKSEVEKLTGKLQASETAAQQAQTELAKLRVALKHGLTETQARRLVGTTDDELEADAKELLASFGQQPAAGPQRRRPSEKLSGGSSGSDGPEPVDMNQIIRSRMGRA